MSVERLDEETTTDRLQVVMHRARYDFALKHLAGATAILEVGTGCGNFSVDLARLPVRFAGIEIDAEAAAQTRRRIGGNPEIHQVDARHLPFGNGEFSHVICLEVLEHLGDYRPAIEEIRRCLVPGGKAIISVPYRKIGGTNPLNPYHLYEPGEQELVDAFREAFEKIEVFYQYYDESWFMTLARRLRLRRFVGLAHRYRRLSEGHPDELARLRLEPAPSGMLLNLVLVASQPRPDPMRLK